MLSSRSQYCFWQITLAATVATVLFFAGSANARPQGEAYGVAPESEIAKQLVETLRARLERELVEEELVGLQATIWQKDSLLFSTAMGYADLDQQVALTEQTRMPIASITKALTGVLYLRLVDSDRIDPEADVRSLVSEYPAKPEGTIALKHLVGQVHGIRHYRDEIYPNFFVHHYDRLVNALEIFAADPLLSIPGESYTYSSYAYTLLGVALERAAEQPFLELLQEEVLDPAGMLRTCTNDVRFPLSGRAECYSFYDFRWPFKASDKLLTVPSLDFSYNAAGGNLLSTTNDLAQFGARILDGQLLGERGLKTLLRSQETTAGTPTGWSHGWFVLGEGEDQELRINGSNPGSWAHLRVYPRRNLVVALATNTWGRTGRENPKGLMGVMDELYAVLVD